MKQLTFLLVFIFISCKSETKMDPKIDKSVYNMWHNFSKANSNVQKDFLPDSWYFHNNKEDANRLAELVLNGKKKATTSGLYDWYVEANADLPTIGTQHIITDFDGKAQAIIEIKKVDTIRFNQLPKAYAEMDMGTNIDPLKSWKKAHWDYFASAMEENDEQPTEEMLIVFERFETIWPVRNK